VDDESNNETTGVDDKSMSDTTGVEDNPATTATNDEITEVDDESTISTKKNNLDWKSFSLEEHRVRNKLGKSHAEEQQKKEKTKRDVKKTSC
jgi:hypothetical protein